MNIITGYKGEPHITSSQDRAGNQGSYGTGSYVLDVGNKLAATVSSSTQIRIADGVICHQGCLANIDAGTYDTVAINNGSQGVNRIDMIVARYTKDSVTSVESIDLVVIQGSPVSGTPTPPSYQRGNIQNGDSPVDMPLYLVRLTGVALSSVAQMFSTIKTQAELQDDINTLNNNIGDIRMKRVSKQVTISDGSTSSPTTTTIDVSNDIGAGHTLVGVVATIGAYILPYATTSGVMQTWLYRMPASGTEIIIENTTTGWGTQTVYLLLFFV